MKTPRDKSGRELVKLLRKYGYEITTQKGSHIKITTLKNGEHHIAVPDHSPIKVGTLNGILNLVANHFSLSKDELMENLF